MCAGPDEKDHGNDLIIFLRNIIFFIFTKRTMAFEISIPGAGWGHH